MRRIQTEQITGTEILAKDIYSGNGVIIIAAGTQLRLEYRNKLQDMHITDIFIEDNISEDIKVDEFTDEAICDKCSDILKNTIERFSYASKNEKGNLLEIAEGVMQSVLEKKEVLYNVSVVRRSDQKLSDHCLSVAALSILTALHAGFTDTQVRDIAVCALLHDIGFINLHTEYQNVILDEAPEEIQKEIKRHVVYGYMSVEKQDWLSPVSKDIILYHHERCDGTGYPFRLVGDRIKPEVRLVSICDAFDNMIYGSLERKMKVYEAMECIMALAGTKFDISYATIFVQSVAAYPIGSIVVTNTGATCIVIRQNNSAPTRPVLRELKKNKQGEWESWAEHDLLEELTVFITDTYNE